MSYHDLFITTESIQRTSIFDLPFNLMLTCTRIGGWELWDVSDGIAKARVIAGEFDSKKWLALDVAGTVILWHAHTHDIGEAMTPALRLRGGRTVTRYCRTCDELYGRYVEFHRWRDILKHLFWHMRGSR